MLIIGLGNPGEKYKNTRHNIGFMVIDQLETLRHAQGKKADFILAKTETFMNESGKFIKSYIHLNYPMVELRRMCDNLLIIHDDIDIAIGQFKIQRGRGAAGHKGVRSIIDELKTNDFWRVRIGICPKRGKPKNVEKFVLQNFTREERRIIKDVIEKITLRLAELAQGKQKS